jgi:hypothetical protein
VDTILSVEAIAEAAAFISLKMFPVRFHWWIF